MTTPNEALLPCPFCGGDDVAVATLKWHFCVQCACEANGPWKQTPASAEIAWNNRAAVAQPVQPAAYKITDNDIKACFKFHLGWNHSQADKTSYRAVLETYESRRSNVAQAQGQFKKGDLVRKRKGSEWDGRIVGFYSTELTPEGYAVESSTHAGSVQIYPAAALELIPPAPAQGAKE